MKTWRKLLFALLLFLLPTAPSCLEAARVQDGVIIQKIGSTYVFIFPTSTGRIKATDNPAGSISVGENIRVAYALKIIRGGSARFIGFYSATMPEPKLKVAKANNLFGFIVKDAGQPSLQIHIQPSFMAETKKKLKEKIAREGNLNVTLERGKNGELRIVRVVLD